MSTPYCHGGDHYFDLGETDYIEADDGSIICLDCVFQTINDYQAEIERLSALNSALKATVAELQAAVIGRVA